MDASQYYSFVTCIFAIVIGLWLMKYENQLDRRRKAYQDHVDYINQNPSEVTDEESLEDATRQARIAAFITLLAMATGRLLVVLGTYGSLLGLWRAIR